MEKQPLRAPQMQLIVYAALFTAGMSTAVGFGASRLWIWMVISLGFTALALFGESTSWSHRLADLTFAGFAALGGWGLLRGVPVPFGLVTPAAALIAWDLHHYRERLAQVKHIEAEPALVRDHVQRLFLTVGAGLGLGAVALLVRMTYSIGVIVVLGFVLAFGLSRAVSYLRKASD
jgi:hypothetical protein